MYVGRIVGLLTAALIWAGPALADDGATINSSVKPSFGGGELEGCQVIFMAAHHNAEYFDSDLALLSGSVNINVFKGKAPSLSLKLGVARTSGGTAGQFQAPTNAYLVNGLETNIRDKITGGLSETPGHNLFIYLFDMATLNALSPSFQDGKITIAYSMKDGSLGSSFVVDMRVSDIVDGKPVYDDTALKRWQECFLALPFDLK